VDAGFENQKELTKMQLDNQKEIAEMQNETQKEIAGIQSATSRQNTKDQVYAQNEMLAYQQKESTARVASIMENTNLSRSEERFSRNAETDLVCRLLLEKKKTPKLDSDTGITESCAHAPAGGPYYAQPLLDQMPRGITA